ncbi:molybdenum cofactor guanylyltransferase [Nitratifractor sp.]
MPELEAVILAGGRSRRMGRDKALLPFGGYESLARYQYERLRPLFARVSLSAKEDKFPFDAPLIPDREEESSPMVALASILAASRSKGVFLLGVDMPFVDEKVIESLKEAFATTDAEIVIAGGPRAPEPLCAIYRPSLLPRVEALLTEGEHRLRSLLEHSDTQIVPFENAGLFRNLNRPEEYAAAKKETASRKQEE